MNNIILIQFNTILLNNIFYYIIRFHSSKLSSREGKRRLSLRLSYGKAEVMTVPGLFDFDSRRPPLSAKIHVDKNHAHPRYSSTSADSQHSTPNAPPTDYLFLRYLIII
jgi:hypothetical protein